MRVAALYDIHGNLPALEAVLDEVPGDAAIVLGGDHVYGPSPAETLDRLRGLGERAIWLRGNCDRELSEPGTGPASVDVLDWVRSRLSTEEREFLHGLSETATLVIDGLGEVFFCHATPRNDVDFFTDVTRQERLTAFFAEVDAATIICGHSHLQFERIIADKLVVNAGSVGMAYENEPGAYWALLGPGVELRHSSLCPARSPIVDTRGHGHGWDGRRRHNSSNRRLLAANNAL
jgi:putative phosphoesterase